MTTPMSFYFWSIALAPKMQRPSVWKANILAIFVRRGLLLS
jgi:hypothetical protein